MNQILDYNPGGSSSNRNDNTNIVFKVFAVMLLLIAIVFIAKGLIEILNENKQKNSGASYTNNTSVDDSEKTKAVINVTQENNVAKITVTHDKVISTVVYQWDDGNSKTIAGENSQNFEKVLDIPTGDHTLYVTVKDVDGVESNYEKELSVENGADIEKPVIDILDIGGGKLKITVTDNVAIDYITYRWNENEEQRIQPSEQDKTKLEIVVDALKETNNLTVAAVDTSVNTAVMTQKIFGGIKPTISVSASEDIKKLIIKVEHEKGIKRIDYTLYNGDPADSSTTSEDHMITDQNGTAVEFTQDLNVGYNRIIIRVTSQDDLTAEFDGEIVSPASTDNPNNSYSNTNTTNNN